MTETVCDNSNCEECARLKEDIGDDPFQTRPSLPNGKMHPDLILDADESLIVYEKFYDNITPRIEKLRQEFNDLNKRKKALNKEFEICNPPKQCSEYDYPICQRMQGIFEDEYRGKTAQQYVKKFRKIFNKIDDKLATLPDFEKRGT